MGRTYKTEKGLKRFEPVIRIADAEDGFLSFRNLVEVHVLAALRRKHQVNLAKVRDALQYLEGRYGTRHPLAELETLTDGKDVFVQKYGLLVNVSQAGQLAMMAILELHLSRIDRDPKGVPIRLFPFATKQKQQDERPVTIDPRIQFGRPCISGTGIPTEEVADRWLAGESMRELARDFDCKVRDIEAALRYENLSAA